MGGRVAHVFLREAGGWAGDGWGERGEGGAGSGARMGGGAGRWRPLFSYPAARCRGCSGTPHPHPHATGRPSVRSGRGGAGGGSEGRAPPPWETGLAAAAFFFFASRRRRSLLLSPTPRSLTLSVYTRLPSASRVYIRYMAGRCVCARREREVRVGRAGPVTKKRVERKRAKPKQACFFFSLQALFFSLSYSPITKSAGSVIFSPSLKLGRPRYGHPAHR